jgi:hypothetical protein
VKKISELVVAEISRSSFHTAMGLPLGESYPEIVSEILAEPRIPAAMLTDLLSTLQSLDTLVEKKAGELDVERLSKAPIVMATPMRWLYWGIQVGRQLAIQEETVLRGLENENG